MAGVDTSAHDDRDSTTTVHESSSMDDHTRSSMEHKYVPAAAATTAGVPTAGNGPYDTTEKKLEDLGSRQQEKPTTVAPSSSPATDDPNIVTWDGPSDPANPRNWPRGYKFLNIALVSASVLCCNLATTIFAPGANQMQRDFGFTSDTIEILTVTIASLGFAVGSLFVPQLSEIFGRVPIYRVCGLFYMGFTVGCARSTTVGTFLAFRVLTGVAASSYMTTGGGTIADLLPAEERGGAMAVFNLGPLLGPVIGPIVGGFLTEYLSWRWTFYIILILVGSVYIPAFFLMRETSTPAILKTKLARLRAETQNPHLRVAGDRGIPYKRMVAMAMMRPMKLLTRSPIVLLMSLYIAFIFGIMMLFFATFPTVFERVYGWSPSMSGLGYLGIGVGCAIGVVMFAKMSDRLVRTGPSTGDEPATTTSSPSSLEQGTNANEAKKVRPERRLLLMIYVAPLVPVGLFIYGWTTAYAVHWVTPIVGTAITGVGMVIIISSTSTYIIDLFGPQAAASALGTVTLLRNLTGSFLPLAAAPLYAQLGLGWGNSVLAFISLAFVGVPCLFFWKGEWLRNRFPVEL